MYKRKLLQYASYSNFTEWLNFFRFGELDRELVRPRLPSTPRRATHFPFITVEFTQGQSTFQTFCAEAILVRQIHMTLTS